MVRRLLLSVALLVSACGDGGSDAEPSRAEQARRVARDAGLGEEVADWLALAAGDPAADYRVAYGELVITQEDGERRVEAGESVQGAVATDLGPFDEAAVERLVTRLRAARDDHTFAVESRRLLGVTARCLVTTPRDGEPEPDGLFCVSDQGAILLLQGASGDLRATEYED